MATQATTVPAGPGHNSGAVATAAASQANLDAWLDACRQFGEAAGAGDTSKIGWFQDMVQRSYRREIDKTMAEKGFDAYVEARAKRATMLGKRAPTGKGADRAVRISEAKCMIELGALESIREKNMGGLGVFNLALKVIGNDTSVKGELEKLMLKVAREQRRRPQEPMDEAYIKQTLRPKDEPEKTEGDALYSIKKQIEKVGADFGYSPEVRAAGTSIGARLEKLNYKTAADRRAEEMARKANLKNEEAKKKAQAAAGNGSKPTASATPPTNGTAGAPAPATAQVSASAGGKGAKAGVTNRRKK